MYMRDLISTSLKSQEHYILYVRLGNTRKLSSYRLNFLIDLAKTSPHILCPERFALHLGTHLVSKYAHIHKAIVTIEKLRWTRIPVGEKKEGHKHSFVRDGEEKKIVKVEIDASGGKDQPMIAKVEAGIRDLLGESWLLGVLD
jgi:urate oxidase